MKKFLLAVMSLLILPAISHAQSVNIESIVYSVNGEEATVADGINATGDITILPEVEIEGKTYPVTSIADGAFGARRSGRKEYIAAITSVDIPASIMSIGQSAFSSSTLNDVVIPETVKTIGNYAFSKCKDLKKAVVNGGMESMGTHLFDGCESLETAIIAEGHTVIPAYSFRDCKALSEVSLPSTLKEIGGSSELGGAFVNCSSLRSIDLPEGLISIGDMGFYVTGLTSLILPEGFKTLGYSAFQSCRSLEEVKLPSTLENLPKAAFRHCSALESIEIPDGIAVIEGGEYNEGCFDHCSSLKNVTLSSNLKEIKAYAFNACSISSIILPESVEELGYRAFCPVKDIEMKSVKCFAKEPPVLGESVFFEEVMPSEMEVLVPESTLDLYRSAEVWKDFNLTGFPDVTSVLVTTAATPTHWTVYTLDGRQLLDTANRSALGTLIPGLYIINGKKTLIH